MQRLGLGRTRQALPESHHLPSILPLLFLCSASAGLPLLGPWLCHRGLTQNVSPLCTPSFLRVWLPLSRKLSQPLGCWPPLNPLLTPAHTEHSRGHPQPRWVLPPCPAPHHAQSKILTQDRAYVFFLCLYCMQYPIGLRDGNYLLLSISRRWIFFSDWSFGPVSLAPFPALGGLTGLQVAPRHPPHRGADWARGFVPAARPLPDVACCLCS